MTTTKTTTDDHRPDLSEYHVHTRHAGMARRIAEQHFHRIVWVVEQKRWLAWNGHCWELDADGVIAARLAMKTVRHARRGLGGVSLTSEQGRELVKDIALCESASGITGALQLTRSMPGMSISAKQLDADPFLLNVANGTLDLRTLELFPHTPREFLTKITLGAYLPDAKAPRWYGFLEKVLPDQEVRDYLQQVYGIGVVGEVLERILPIFIGSGNNGKSTLVEATNTALGSYASAVTPELLIASSKGSSGLSPEKMALRGLRIATMVETEDGAKMDAATMKNLTGGDTITGRGLYESPVTFEPSHLPIMATNHLPEVPADAPALWARLAVVPFDVIITDEERDSTLHSALVLEADGIVSWAVGGWTAYHEADRFAKVPGAVSDRTTAYQKDSDLVAKWVDDFCVLGPHYVTSTSQLWDSWLEWCRNNRRQPGRMAGLRGALLKRDDIRDARSATQRALGGIALTPG